MSGSLGADSESPGFLPTRPVGGEGSGRGHRCMQFMWRPHGAPRPQDSEAGTAFLSCPTFRKRDRTFFPTRPWVWAALEQGMGLTSSKRQFRQGTQLWAVGNPYS